MLKNKKILIISILVLLAVIGVGAYYFNNKDTDSDITGDGINYGPPTAQQKKDAEDNKKSIDENESSGSNDSNSPKKVKPVITSFGQVGSSVKVSARVPGIFESKGTCTLNMTKDGMKVSQSKAAAQNVSEMSCGFITIERSKLSAGEWTAVMSYSSDNASGSSDKVTIGIK